MSVVQESPSEALTRIQSKVSQNDFAVIHQFYGCGISAEDIIPRANVLTFRAWSALKRRVAKGATGQRITVWVPISDKEGETKTRPITAVLFHISQTVDENAESGTKPDAWENPLLVKSGTYDDQSGGKDKVPSSTIITAKPVQRNHSAAIADKLRSLADAMEGTIQQKLAPCSQNYTPKRGRQAAQRNHEGRNLHKAQQAMQVLADLWEAGTVPEILRDVKTKTQILNLVSTSSDNSRGYYDYREIDAFKNNTEQAITLRELVESHRTPEQIKQQAKAAKELQIREATDRLRLCDRPGFFPTPKNVCQRMIFDAEFPSDATRFRILEPSAGIGSLCDAVVESCPEATIDAVETLTAACDILTMKGYHNHCGDFLSVDPCPVYDRVLMNPPFENGQDICHVQHAFKFLRPGGKLVAIMSESPFTGTRNNHVDFRNWLDWHNGTSEPLKDAFNTVDAFRRTGVSVRVVVIDKTK